jgi:hypothetical protein
MANVQKINICINMPSSQTFRSFPNVLPLRAQELNGITAVTSYQLLPAVKRCESVYNPVLIALNPKYVST